MDKTKIATMHTIAQRNRKAAIVLAAVKGEALLTTAAYDGEVNPGRNEGMVRELIE
jgi:hypothetical protein